MLEDQTFHFRCFASDYSGAYITGVTNRYKKATIDVVKVDKYSKDKKPHGDASLEAEGGNRFARYDENAGMFVEADEAQLGKLAKIYM